MNNSGMDISALFSGLNSNDTFGGINLSDYASIKNGSYGKLVKSYYAEQAAPKDSGSKNESDAKDWNVTAASIVQKSASVDTTGLSQIKKEADGLKSSVEAFENEDLWKEQEGKFDKDAIAGAVQSFVKEYNDVISKAEKVNAKGVTSNVNNMKSMTSTMSKYLSKIGVNVGKDGKLSVSEDKLKDADVNNIKSLFTGKASYASQTFETANAISKEAVNSSSLYGNDASKTSSISGLFNEWI